MNNSFEGRHKKTYMNFVYFVKKKNIKDTPKMESRE